MNKQQLIFWKSEQEMLDRLYCDRMREWLRGWRPGASAPTQRPESQELEVAYQQTARAIAGLYEFAPQEEVEAPEVAENGQAPELELAEA